MGAGASANSLPVSNQYIERFEILKDFILRHRNANQCPNSPKLDEIFSDFDWIIQQIKGSDSSVDSLAKSFFDKNDRVDINKIKKILTFFFIIEQLRNPLDKRYLPFLVKIWPGPRSQLPCDKIRIINWNYDCQVEMSLGRLANYTNQFESTNLKRQCLPSSLYLHEDSIQTDFYASCARDSFTLCHLNGICYCYKHDVYKSKITQASMVSFPFPELFDPFESPPALMNELNKQIDNYCDLMNRAGNFPGIEFAWETPEINRTPHTIRTKVVEKAIEVTNKTEILVIIGYSFPRENLEIDRDVISSMGSLKKIFIQDKSPLQVKKRIADLYQENFRVKSINFEIVDNVSDFIAPINLFQNQS